MSRGGVGGQRDSILFVRLHEARVDQALVIGGVGLRSGRGVVKIITCGAEGNIRHGACHIVGAGLASGTR